MNNHQIRYTFLHDISSQERLEQWYQAQLLQEKTFYYILPSVQWFQQARKRQPGLEFKTFDDVADLLLKQANKNYNSISDIDRILLFQDILKQDSSLRSEQELVHQAKACSDTYGQLKRLGLTVKELPKQLQPLSEIFEAFEKLFVEEAKLFDSENRIHQAVSIQQTNVSFGHIVIDGYFDFSPIQYLMIEYLLKQNVPITIYLPAVFTPLVNETENTLQRLGFIQAETKPEPQKVRAHIKTLHGGTTIQEEIEGVLETIKQKTKEERFDYTGIVLSNESLYKDELITISEKRNIPLKQIKKKSCMETSFGQFLYLLFSFNQDNMTKWEKVVLLDKLAELLFIHASQYSKLKHQYLLDEQVNPMIDQYLEKTLLFLNQIGKQNCFKDYLSHCLTFITDLDLVSFYKTIIRNAEMEKNHFKAAEHWRVISTIITLLEQEQESLENRGILHLETTISSFAYWFFNRLDNENLFIDRAPSDGIVIHTFSDVALFRGKRLFVLGMNEGVFPRDTRLGGYFQESYLKQEQFRYPIPGLEYFRKKDDTLFAQLDYMAESLSFSYVSGINEQQLLLPSKYMIDSQIEKDPEPSYTLLKRFGNNQYETKLEYEEMISFQIGLGRESKHLPSKLANFKENIARLTAGEEILSKNWKDYLTKLEVAITRLESYADCSFKYAMEHVLKVSEPLQKKTKLDPRETGSMLHKVIEGFYKDITSIPFSEIEQYYEGEEQRILMEIFCEEWKKLERSHPEVSQKVLKREKEVWQSKLEKWLVAEKLRYWTNDALKDMRIFKLEESVSLSFPLATGETLILKGKIDRLDIDEQGFVIYDYKSSSKQLDFKKAIPAGVTLQIPMYMIALEKEFNEGKYKRHATVKPFYPIGGGYISLKEPYIRKKNTVWRDEDQKIRFEPKYNTHIEEIHHEGLEFTYKLNDLVESLWRGMHRDFSVKPFAEDSCKYCLFKATCRVSHGHLEENGGGQHEI